VLTGGEKGEEYHGTTIVVHSRDVKDCGDVLQRKLTLKPAKIPDMAVLVR